MMPLSEKCDEIKAIIEEYDDDYCPYDSDSDSDSDSESESDSDSDSDSENSESDNEQEVSARAMVVPLRKFPYTNYYHSNKLNNTSLEGILEEHEQRTGSAPTRTVITKTAFCYSTTRTMKRTVTFTSFDGILDMVSMGHDEEEHHEDETNKNTSEVEDDDNMHIVAITLSIKNSSSKETGDVVDDDGNGYFFFQDDEDDEEDNKEKCMDLDNLLELEYYSPEEEQEECELNTSLSSLLTMGFKIMEMHA